jgi:S1-C subfamily serine protease
MGKESRERKRLNAQRGLGPAVGTVSRRDLFARVRQSVVAIVDLPDDWAVNIPAGQQPLASMRLIGSGFVIPGGFVLTAKHVIQQFVDAFTAWNQTRQGPQPRQAKLLFSTTFTGSESNNITMQFAIAQTNGFSVANSYDMAALRIAPPPPGAPINVPPPLTLATSPAEEGDDVAICGYPLGMALHQDLLGGVMLSPSFSRGIVGAVLPHPQAPLHNRTMLQIDAMINQGNSGGPVFDVRNGNVVGVVVSKFDNTVQTAPGQLLGGESVIRIPSGIARALPIHMAQLVIDSLRQVG